jgi:hypothetical protein
MSLDELIRKLQDTQRLYPNSQVLIATSRQVLGDWTKTAGMNTAHRIPIANGSGLGDQDGEVESLFIVTETK